MNAKITTETSIVAPTDEILFIFNSVHGSIIAAAVDVDQPQFPTTAGAVPTDVPNTGKIIQYIISRKCVLQHNRFGEMVNSVKKIYADRIIEYANI